ncbi:MAG: LuxR C-terminal-related transcriptional regulator [Ignavibacteriaceae bacterium]
MKNDNKDFTKRELEILLLISECNKNYKIASKLFISHHTVESHKAHLIKKIKLKNTTELSAFAILHKEHITIQLQKVTANCDKTKNNNGGTLAKTII